jgi:hypothetical protein
MISNLQIRCTAVHRHYSLFLFPSLLTNPCRERGGEVRGGGH